MKYIIRHADNDHDIPGTITFPSENDDQAKACVKDLVERGFRDSAWASVDLADGSTYSLRNKLGKAVGGTVKAT